LCWINWSSSCLENFSKHFIIYFVAVCCFTFLASRGSTKDHAKAWSIVEVALAIAAPLKRSIHSSPKQRSLAHTHSLSIAFLLLSVFARNTWHKQAGPHDLQLLLSKFDYNDSGVLCSLELQERHSLMLYSHSRAFTQINFFLNNDLMYYSFHYAFNHLSLYHLYHYFIYIIFLYMFLSLA